MPNDFAFISVGDPGKSSDADRLLIRSHVMRGRNKRLGSRRCVREAARRTDAPPATSAITRGRKSALRESTGSSPEPADTELAVQEQDGRKGNEQPRKGFAAACIQLDQQIRSRSGVFASLDNTETGYGELISELLKYDSANAAAFPIKQSIEFDEPENACVPWIFSNMAFAHSVFFATSATNDFRLGRPFTSSTLIYLKRTIRCLNKQLGEDGGHLDDSTTYTIVTLAILATLFGDLTAARAHMIGLQRIIGLRGGESYLSERPKQYFMLERLDLTWSVQSGALPHYSHEPVDWRSAFTGPRAVFDTTSLALMVAELVDSRLATVFQDFQRLTKLINAHAEKDGRLKGDIFQHVLGSIQRRLLWLRFPQDDGWSERLRLGMLAYLTTTFQLSGRKISYDYLSARYRLSCQMLEASTLSTSMRTLTAWLLLVGATSVFEPSEPWLRATWNDTAIAGENWEDAQHRLESVLWISHIQDETGRRAYAALTQ